MPRIVVYNVNAMRYSEPVSEAYNRLTMDRKKWSKEKADMILASMTEEESFWSYVYPAEAQSLYIILQGQSVVSIEYRMNTD